MYGEKQKSYTGAVMRYEVLKKKIISKKANICIIGLGYVGLPLAVEFARAGFKVTGVDVSNEKVSSLKEGKSYIEDVSREDIVKIIKDKKFVPTIRYSGIKNQDVIIICVPTPLRKTREPDLSFIIEASEKVSNNLSESTLVILESTSYPGTTREILLPKFEEKGFKGGVDVFVAFSPERVDPGNEFYGIKNTPKIVGGIDKKSLELAREVYAQVVDKVITVNSCEEAEMVKLIENTFRAVNIGLINELAMLCNKLNLDIWNIIRAAATKPFGFMPFYPGPGLGGHCLPVDPQFLSWKAKSHLFYPRFIDYAEEINRLMPGYVVEKISKLLNENKKCVKDSKILLMGVSYKKNVGDLRESPAFDIVDRLKNLSASVFFTDPYARSFSGVKRISYNRINYKEYDCVVIVTAHEKFDYIKILEESKAVVDCRGVTLGLKGKAKVVRI